MNDYYKSIDWPGRIQSVQVISYKWLIQILLSACIFLSFLCFYPSRVKSDHALRFIYIRDVFCKTANNRDAQKSALYLTCHLGQRGTHARDYLYLCQVAQDGKGKYNADFCVSKSLAVLLKNLRHCKYPFNQKIDYNFNLQHIRSKYCQIIW